MSRLVHILRAGKLGYQPAVKLQKELSNIVLSDKEYKNVLILTKHDPVYTVGIRTKDYTIKDEEKLKALGADFQKTNRGGLITFHGPGQLVAYPIINLKNFQPSIRWYVSHIEKTIIDLCRKYKLRAQTTSDTGVWIEDRKICAIGIHASRYITTHGLALNCDTDLKWFEHIVPCGIQGKSVTSLTKELNRPTTISEVTPDFLESFSSILECDLVEFDGQTTENILKSIY